MNRAQRLKFAASFMEIEAMVADLQHQRDLLLTACRYVVASGPLNNGMKDEATMAFMKTAIEEVGGSV